MRFVAVRALFAYLCLYLVLPAGWCCYVGARECCSRPEETAKAPAAPKKSCCCPADEAPTPEAPPVKLPPAAKCWCCERSPTVLAGKEQFTPDLPFAGMLSVVTDLVTTDSRLEPSPNGGPDPPAALHILHCVWLC